MATPATAVGVASTRVTAAAPRAAGSTAKDLPVASLAPDLEARARALGHILRCPVCQGMPIAESPAGMAVDMMQRVRQMLLEGQSDVAVIDYFTSRYGQWVLLDPPRRGAALWVWLLPPALLVALLAWSARRVGVGVAGWARAPVAAAPEHCGQARQAEGGQMSRCSAASGPRGPAWLALPNRSPEPEEAQRTPDETTLLAAVRRDVAR